MLKECLEKEERESELERELNLRRSKINYLVDQLDYCNTFRKKKRYIVFFITALIFCEVLIFISTVESLTRVLTSLITPLVISFAIMYLGNKAETYMIALNFENELFDICNFIKEYDKLRNNEEYIMKYISTNKEKYIGKNSFDAITARGAY